MGIQTSPAPFIRTSSELHLEDFLNPKRTGTSTRTLLSSGLMSALSLSTFSFLMWKKNLWQVAQFMSHPEATDFHCKELGLTSIHIIQHIIQLEKVIESRISCEHPHHPHHPHHHIWVNHTISLPWIVRPFWDDSPNYDSRARSQGSVVMKFTQESYGQVWSLDMINGKKK